MTIVETLVDIMRSIFSGKNELTPDEIAIMREGLRQEQDRLDSISRNRNAYAGHFPLPLKIDTSDPNNPINHNVIVNRIMPIVDHGVHYLFGGKLDYEIPEEFDGEKQKGKKSELEKELERCLDSFNFPAWLLKWAQAGGLGGTAYYRIRLPDPADEEHPVYPWLEVLDPGCTSILWHPRDMGKRIGYVWRYNSAEQLQSGGARARVDQQVVTRELLTNGQMGWVIRDQYYLREYGRDGQIQTVNESVWPYPWCPIEHCQNLPDYSSVYGRADIDDLVIELNLSTNRVLSDRKKILFYHASPLIYATGIGAGSIVRDANGVLILQGADTTLGQLVPGISGMEAESLEKAIYEAIGEITHTPGVAMGKPDDSGVPESGIARAIRYTPIVNKTEAKHRTYGPALVTALQRLLDVMGKGEQIRPSLTWPEVMPSDPKAEAETLQIHADLGVSKQTVLGKLGYSYEDELANIEEEASAEQSRIAGKQEQINAFRMASDVPQTPEEMQAMQQEQMNRQQMDMEDMNA